MQIDKAKIYEVSKYSFQNFTTLSENQILKVWEWRNHPDIRKYMYNTEEIPYDCHVLFIKRLKERCDVLYWIAYFNNEPIGVINLTSIDEESSRAELGYYMIPEKMNSGLGIDFVFHILCLVFEQIEIDELFGSIHEDNKNAIVLDSFMGCKLSGLIPIDNNSDAKYVSWTLKGQDFLNNKEEKNNLRNFVRYAKSFRR